MNCSNNNADIITTYIIGTQDESQVVSACTTLFTNLVESCSGDTSILMGTGEIIINKTILPSNPNVNIGSSGTPFNQIYILSANTSYLSAITATMTTLSGGTLYGDGSNLTGIVGVTVTGGTYTAGTATFTNNTGGTFSVIGFLTGTTDNYITGGTFTNNNLILTNNSGGTVNILINNFTGLTVNGSLSATTYLNLPVDIRVTGGTYTNGTATFTNNTGGTFSVSGLYSGVSENNFWSTTGNTGLNANINFIGTKDDTDVVIKRNNIQQAIFKATNTFIGSNAGLSTTGTNLTFIGIDSGRDSSNNNDSIGIGFNASNSSRGEWSVGVGRFANYSSVGNQVTSIGNGAGVYNESDSATHIGNGAGGYSTAYQPVNIGNVAGFSGSGNYIVSIGVYSNANNTGSYSIGVGYGANSGNSGSNVVSIGREAGIGNDKNNVVLLGPEAMPNQNGQLVLSPYINNIRVSGFSTGVGYVLTDVSGDGILTLQPQSGGSGTDVFVTGGTYTAGTATFTNNTGGTFNVSGFNTTNTFTGGTVTGATNFTNGLSANTISATTYLNLPVDVRVTGGTYTAGTATFTNNTGGTFSVSGLYSGGTDVFVTGSTFSNNTLIFRNNTGGTFNVLINNLSGLTVNGSLLATTVSATTYQNLPQDIYVTGGTFTNNYLVLTNNTGGDINVGPFNLWSTTGNTGLNSSTNFIGTLDATDVVIKRNNIQQASFGDGLLFMGSDSGLNYTGVFLGTGGIIAIGSGACQNVSGFIGDTIAIGTNAGSETTNIFTGMIYIGPNAGRGSTTGPMIAIGSDAGLNNAFGNVIILGDNATASTSNQLCIGPNINNIGLAGFSTGVGYVLTDVSGDGILTLQPQSGGSGTDVFVTGGTYTAGTATFTNNTGGTFNVSGFVNDVWSTTGNSGTTAGVNYIGTNDNVDVVIKRDSVQHAYFSSDSTAIGKNAGVNTTLSQKYLAIGENSLYNSINMINVIGVGESALSDCSSINNTIGIGYFSGYNNRGNNNSFIGYASGVQNIGDYVIGLGEDTAVANSGSTLIVIGHQSGVRNRGNNSIFIGDISGLDNLGDNVIGIGQNTGQNNPYDNVILLGTNVSASTANQFALSNDITSMKVGGFSTGVGYVLTDVSGNGILTLQPSASGSTDTTITGGTFVNNILNLINNTGGTISTLIDNFTGLTVNGNISATTYLNLPVDIRVTGGTYTAGTATFTNNTGGTFSVSGFSINTVVTGGTYTAGTATFRNNTGGTFSVSGFSTGTTISFAPIDSVPNANGATISNNIITLQPASASFGGVMTNGVQTFAGNKTFNGSTTLSAVTVAPYLTTSGFVFTGSSPSNMIDINGTWNSTGATSTVIRMNITNTASSTANQLVDFQVGGVTQFSIAKTGSIFVLNNVLGSYFYNNSTPANANFETFSTVAGITSAIGLNGSSSTVSRFRIGGATSSTIAANSSYSSLFLQSSPVTIAASGTHPVFSTLGIKAPTITTGAGTLSNAATLFVEGAPNFTGSTNYSIFVPSGANRFDGFVYAPKILGGTGSTSTLTLQATSGTGTTGSDIIFLVGASGATEAFKITNAGSLTSNAGSISIGGGVDANLVKSANYLRAGATSIIFWNGRSIMNSPIDGQITLSNAGATSFTRLNLGLNTSSAPAIAVSGTGINIVLADASAYTGLQSLYHRFGSGSPEGVVTAPIGCLYSRTDGGAGSSLYVKESGTGNTGWVAK